MKAKSLEGIVCYGIRAEALKLLAKYLPILAFVKPPLIRERARSWVLQAIYCDIIQLADRDCMARVTWCQLDNRNDPLEECFAVMGIVEPSEPVTMLYTSGFCDPLNH